MPDPQNVIDALEVLAANKRDIAITEREVREIDLVLANEWGIDFVDSPDLLPERLESLARASTRERASTMRNASALAAGSRGAIRGSEDLLDVMGRHPEVFGAVTSTRRAFILDSIAYIGAITRALEIASPILDVGCHAGFSVDVLGRVLGIDCAGIDPVRSAIEYGRARVPQGVGDRLTCAGLPWKTSSRFSLVSAIDSAPGGADRGAFLRDLAGLLEVGGVAIVVSQHLRSTNRELLNRQLRGASLGFVLADVVGGYGDAPTTFSAEGLMCFVKGIRRDVPLKYERLMESEWPRFRDYANDPRTPKREKTQAFERASRRRRSDALG